VDYASLIRPARPHDADVAWLSGADGFLTKPFKVDELREKIEEVFSRREEELSLVG
jgi:DNA-binding response OmpR family regulator